MMCPGCGKEWPDGYYHCGVCHDTFTDVLELTQHWDSQTGLCIPKNERSRLIIPSKGK